MSKQKHIRESGALKRIRVIAGIAGCVIAAVFFAWLPLGFVPGISSMVDVFGVTGIRTPASITVAGLLLAAIGFYDH